MDINLLIVFIVLNIANVIIQTVKSIATIKCGKTGASIINAIAYGLYTVVIVYTVCDLPVWMRIVVVALANLIGVYVVKLLEEKSRKDKLWLVKITIPTDNFEIVKEKLNNKNIPYTYYDIKKYYVINTFCETQQDTLFVSDLCKNYNGKAFATENKLSL